MDTRLYWHMHGPAATGAAGMGIPNTLLKLLYRDVKHGPHPDRTFSRPEARALPRTHHLRLRFDLCRPCFKLPAELTAERNNRLSPLHRGAQ